MKRIVHIQDLISSDIEAFCTQRTADPARRLSRFFGAASGALLTISFFFAGSALAQKEKKPIIQGNDFYKNQDFNKSAEAYGEALKLAPYNPLANYNMGNTQFRLEKFEDAIERYNTTINSSRDKKETEQAFYNKGVSYTKQRMLDESIAAYKEALKLNPKDQEARENLQKALFEKKQQDQQQQQQDKDNKDQKDKKDQDKKDQNKNEQDKKDQDKKNNEQNDENKKDEQNKKNQQQPSKLTKQQVEQLLNAMAQKEKEVREKLMNNEKEKQKKRSMEKPEKDW